MSALNNYLEKYRSLSLERRLFLCLFVGLIAPSVQLFMDYEVKNNEIAQAELSAKTTQAKLKTTQEKIKTLSQVESKKIEIENELKEAKKFLPDQYELEKLLQTASNVSKDTGITLQQIQPKTETYVQKEHPYYEMKVELVANGTYQQIGSFFDRVLHEERNVYLKNITISRLEQKPTNPNDKKNNSDPRNEYELQAKSELYVMRSASAEQILKEQDKTKKNPQGKTPVAKPIDKSAPKPAVPEKKEGPA